MGTAGIFSVIWGLVYNSFFGFEGFFPYEPLIHAKDDMLTLPGLGSLNTVFVLAIAFGMFMKHNQRPDRGQKRAVIFE